MLTRWPRSGVSSIALRPNKTRGISSQLASIQRLCARAPHGDNDSSSTRSLGSNRRSKKRKQQKRRDQELNFQREQRRKQTRLNNLHPAGKWKRILSAADYWFSEANLASDAFLRSTLHKHHGWLPISVLLTFPKFQYWTSAQLLIDAFTSTGAKRYQLVYSRQLCEQPQSKIFRQRNHVDNLREEPGLVSTTNDKESSDDEDSAGEDDWLSRDSEERAREELEINSYDDEMEESSPDEGDDVYDWGSTPDEEDDLLLNDSEFEEEQSRGHDEELAVDTGSTQNEESNVAIEVTGDDRAFVNPFRLEGVIDTEHVEKYALITHNRITKELLESIEYGGTEYDSEEDEVDAFEEEAVKKSLVASRSTKKYSTERPVVIVKNPGQLQSFCSRLEDSTRAFAKSKAGDDTSTAEKACAIGMDVEYCTLELDIRGTLPALIQLSSPDPAGPVGLIWIDKFPDHGKTMLADPACGPLIRLFSDPTLLKVGVGVTKDATHLAKWWGLAKNDKRLFFAGLSEIGDDLYNSSSLQDLCYSKLGLRLLKLKDLDAKRKRDKKRKGKRVQTSHWRADGMTPDMKQYAVNDAACSVDVWKQIHGIRGQGDSFARTHAIDEKEFF